MRGLLVLLCLSACASSNAARSRPSAQLLVRCDVADAALWIDEELVGEAGELGGGVRVPAGAHRVELRHDGYFTRYADVKLAPGEIRQLEVHMAEALP